MLPCKYRVTILFTNYLVMVSRVSRLRNIVQRIWCCLINTGYPLSFSVHSKPLALLQGRSNWIKSVAGTKASDCSWGLQNVEKFRFIHFSEGNIVIWKYCTVRYWIFRIAYLGRSRIKPYQKFKIYTRV